MKLFTLCRIDPLVGPLIFGVVCSLDGARCKLDDDMIMDESGCKCDKWLSMASRNFLQEFGYNAWSPPKWEKRGGIYRDFGILYGNGWSRLSHQDQDVGLRWVENSQAPTSWHVACDMA